MNMPLETQKSCFAPVTDARSRVVILGSLPGAASLAAGQYYANPRNQFWQLMSDVLGADLVMLDYASRLAALGEAGVGLWDVVGSAERRGSLDADIRAIQANPLPAFVETLPSLQAVAFNGGTAAKLGMPILSGHLELSLLALPSSSAANTIGFERKRGQWRQLAAFLGDQ